MGFATGIVIHLPLLVRLLALALAQAQAQAKAEIVVCAAGVVGVVHPTVHL
jgi:hypothetical protein